MAAETRIPGMHVDDCTDTTCVACRLVTATSIAKIDDWLDRAHVFAKQYWENVDGELVITGLRVGHYPTHLVAKFGDVIVRHQDGTHTLRLSVWEKPDEFTAAAWNALYPIGTPVVAYPGARPEMGGADCERLETTTRTKAWTAHGHTPVVMVHGHGAYIQLTHCDPIETKQVAS